MIKILLDEKMKKLGLSNREAARQIGVSHTTLNRILEGGDFDLTTLIQISNWLQVNPATLLGTLSPSADQTVSQCAVLLQSVPALANVFAEAARRVAAGTMSPDTFRDLAAYAAFRVEIHKGENIEHEQQAHKEIE